MSEEFIIFTDESYITDSRFPTISSLSLPLKHYELFNNKLEEILKETGVKEFKWEELRKNKYYFCAEKIIKLVMDNIFKYDLRLDTITWDNYDSRHTVKNRDDHANFERMFYQLLKAAMNRRPKNAIWHIRPDQRNGIDWQTIHKCLHYTGEKKDLEYTLFGSYIQKNFSIKSFKEKESHEEILIQIPDLFSGMASYIRLNFDRYEIWEKYKEPPQLSLFGSEDNKNQEDEIKFSKKENSSYELIYNFNNICKAMSMGVSLKKTRGFKTFQPNRKINFWPYSPIGDYDKAPTKNSKN